MSSGFSGLTDGAILFGALMVSLVILLNAFPIGEKLGTLDHPDAVRKKHAQVTPLVGGLAIMVPLLLWAGATLIWNTTPDRSLLLAVLLGGAGATLVGYADDQSSTSPSSRLFSLFLLSSVALVVDPALVPTHLDWGSFAPTAIPAWVAYVFVAIAMAGYVNSVNMADGQNGLVSGMYVIWAACLMITTGGISFSVAQVILETAGAMFLFNMANRTFLGDAGTYGVTFVFGILAIYAHNRWHVTAETVAVWFFIPVVDCIRLMITRALGGKAPSNADRNHFHHRLQDRVGKTWGLCIYLGSVGLSSLVASVQPRLSLLCMVVLAAFYFSFAWLTELEVVADDVANGEAPSESGTLLRFDRKDASGDRS